MSNNQLNGLQTMGTLTPEVTVRDGRAGDRAELARLAELDSNRVPAGPTLVAEVSGRIQAAISVLDGVAIADPFRRTEDLVRMLRMRAGFAERSRGHGVRAFGHSSWGEKQPRPSAPGIPALPNHTA